LECDVNELDNKSNDEFKEMLQCIKTNEEATGAKAVVTSSEQQLSASDPEPKSDCPPLIIYNEKKKDDRA
jgi:hypothetical protein